MSQRNDDFEFDDFEFGDGSDGFVPDDDFGSNSNMQAITKEEHSIKHSRNMNADKQIMQNSVNSNQRPNQQNKSVTRSNTGANKQQRLQQSQARNTGSNQQTVRRSNEQSQDLVPRRNRPQQSNMQREVQMVSKADRGRMKGQQRVNQQNQVMNPNQQLPNQVRQPQVSQLQDNTIPMIESNEPPKKKKSKLPIIIIAVILLAVIIGVVLIKGNKQIPQDDVYEQSGRYAYDSLLSALNSYDATQIDTVVGSVNGDSYLAQEWSYANNNSIREDFIRSICANVSFTYPQTQQLSTSGEVMSNKDGSPILITSSMNNGESVTVTHVDYVALSETMKEDKINIVDLYKDSGISEEDYEYEEKMTDLMLDYILSRGNLPTTSTEVTLGVSVGSSPLITDDTELDKLLFSSDEFHNMCDTFAQVATEFTGFETEKYTEKEEQPNPEYTQWKMRFDAYYEADGGRFRKGVSKWEPWYLRDENNNYVYDENGQKIVNYYTIKDDQGNDWIQPSKTVIVDVEKERQVEVDWVKESVIPYCFIGAYYCQNEYSGSYSPDVRVGDGSLEYPAGVGTPIITKCLGNDGEYYDVKVTLTGYWVGQDAIDYAISFSEKNRGFDISSVIQLICYEIKVENLEDKEFTFNSDMFLADRNSNKSARTGKMYGFLDSAILGAGESVVINDWATSTELNQKYVCWGSSFSRNFDAVYFKVLAGEGDVPPYSAYKAFTGESNVSEQSNDVIENSEGTENSEITNETSNETVGQ